MVDYSYLRPPFYLSCKGSFEARPERERERERDQREKVGIVFIRMWYFPGSVVVAASFSTYDRLGRSRLTWNSPQVIGGYTRTRTPTKEVDYPLFRNNLPRFASLPDHLTLLT